MAEYIMSMVINFIVALERLISAIEGAHERRKCYDSIR